MIIAPKLSVALASVVVEVITSILDNSFLVLEDLRIAAEGFSGSTDSSTMRTEELSRLPFRCLVTIAQQD